MGANQVHEDRRTNRMRTVTAASVVANDESVEGLAPTVIEALGELAGAAKEGLLALSVGVGLGVLHELMEAEVVRHEALLDRARCETSPPGCRGSLVKLGAVRARNCG
jgi:hypothetical protein